MLSVLALIDSLEQGGAETSLAALVPALRDHGVALDFAVLRAGDGPPRRAALGHGATVYDLLSDAGRRGNYRAILAHLRHRRPDVIHTTLFEAGLVGRLAGRRCGIPVVSSYVGTAFAEPSAPAVKRLAVRMLDATTARCVDEFHAVTPEVAAAASRFCRIPRSRFHVVPRGRDIGALAADHPDAPRLRRELAPGGGPLVLAVGRHEPQKRLDVAVRALALLPGTTLAIAGRPGRSTASLAALAEDLGVADRLRLLGTRDDVGGLLHAADAYVLTSDNEGAAGALIEAAAAGLPAVATDLPTLRWSFPRGVTWVPVGDHRAVASAVGALLADSDEAAARAAAARDVVSSRFTLEAAAAGTAAVYRSAARR